MPGLLAGPYANYDPSRDPYVSKQPNIKPQFGGSFYPNLAKGLLASIPSLAGDMIDPLLRMRQTLIGGGRAPRTGLTSQKMAGLLGADYDDPGFQMGLIGAPDPSDLLKAAPKGLLAMTLFHGTPHKFDRFALDKIGTGEGAQAFGHGLYFAENPDVAGSYARSVTARGNTFGNPNMARRVLDENGGDKKSALAQLNRMARATDGPHRQMFYDTANNFDELLTTKGHIYEVGVPDEITNKMLDWDAPLSEQPESVRKALDGAPELAIRDGMSVAGGGKLRISEDSDFGTKYFLDMDGKSFRLTESEVRNLVGSGSEGKSVYQALSAKLGGDEAASAWLKEQGIPGIRFYDGGSRAKGEGTRNIVLFNPDDITSVKRDGELVWENKLGLR